MKKKRISVLNILLVVIVLICFSVAGICIAKLSAKMKEYRESAELYTAVSEQFVTSSTSSAPTPSSSSAEAEDDLEPIYDEISPIEVDFKALCAENEDVIGWIYCEGTKINYPVVQGEDNRYYLHRLVDKSYNFGGTIFMDVACDRNFLAPCSILYGHHMNDGSMFASICDYHHRAGEYYAEHPCLYLNTPTQNYRLDVFSCIVTYENSDVYRIGFDSDYDRQAWVDMIRDKSYIKELNEGVEAGLDTRFVLLSTCSYEYNNARTVVICTMNPIG